MATTPNEPKKKQRELACLVPWCGKTCRNRGLCLTHYTAISKLVRAGECTWTALEMNGKCLPANATTGSRETLKNWALGLEEKN